MCGVQSSGSHEGVDCLGAPLRINARLEISAQDRASKKMDRLVETLAVIVLRRLFSTASFPSDYCGSIFLPVALPPRGLGDWGTGRVVYIGGAKRRTGNGSRPRSSMGKMRENIPLYIPVSSKTAREQYPPNPTADVIDNGIGLCWRRNP